MPDDTARIAMSIDATLSPDGIAAIEDNAPPPIDEIPISTHSLFCGRCLREPDSARYVPPAVDGPWPLEVRCHGEVERRVVEIVAPVTATTDFFMPEQPSTSTPTTGKLTPIDPRTLRDAVSTLADDAMLTPEARATIAAAGGHIGDRDRNGIYIVTVPRNAIDALPKRPGEVP